MSRPASTRDLRPRERTFLAAMSQLWFGRFEFVRIERGEIVIDPWPTAVRDIKFAAGKQIGKPPEPTSNLGPQVVEFFSHVRDVESGEIRQLEVRHGLPFSMEIEYSGGRRG